MNQTLVMSNIIFHDLVQNCDISSALAMEVIQFYAEPLISFLKFHGTNNSRVGYVPYKTDNGRREFLNLSSDLYFSTLSMTLYVLFLRPFSTCFQACFCQYSSDQKNVTKIFIWSNWWACWKQNFQLSTFHSMHFSMAWSFNVFFNGLV